MRFLFVLAALLASTAATPVVGFPHVERRLIAGEPILIVAFGSSSTAGAGASSRAASYPSRLQADLRSMLPGRTIVVDNRGVGGEDVDDMLARLPAIIAEKPNLVIWQTGSNDPLRHVPLQHYIDGTRRGIAAMRAAGIDVMLMDPQFCRVLRSGNIALPYRDALHIIGGQSGVPVIPRYTMMQEWLARHELTETDMLAPDGLHLADGGYARLANEVATMILSLSHKEAETAATD